VSSVKRQEKGGGLFCHLDINQMLFWKELISSQYVDYIKQKPIDGTMPGML